MVAPLLPCSLGTGAAWRCAGAVRWLAGCVGRRPDLRNALGGRRPTSPAVLRLAVGPPERGYGRQRAGVSWRGASSVSVDPPGLRASGAFARGSAPDARPERKTFVPARSPAKHRRRPLRRPGSAPALRPRVDEDPTLSGTPALAAGGKLGLGGGTGKNRVEHPALARPAAFRRIAPLAHGSDLPALMSSTVDAGKQAVEGTVGACPPSPRSGGGQARHPSLSR